MELPNYNKALINQIFFKRTHTNYAFVHLILNGAEWKKKCENQLIREKTTIKSIDNFLKGEAGFGEGHGLNLIDDLFKLGVLVDFSL